MSKKHQLTEEEKKWILDFFEQEFPYEEAQQFCMEHDISIDDFLQYCKKLSRPEQCRDCIHVKQFDLLYPCIKCSRNPLIQDMYEKKGNKNN